MTLESDSDGGPLKCLVRACVGVCLQPFYQATALVFRQLRAVNVIELQTIETKTKEFCFEAKLNENSKG